jgi:hypothetical protein
MSIIDWWFDIRMQGLRQGIFLRPETLTLQRGLNQIYQEPQKQDQRWRMTRRRSNHRVMSQIRKATENRAMEVMTKKVQSSIEYMISPAFFMNARAP